MPKTTTTKSTGLKQGEVVGYTPGPDESSRKEIDAQILAINQKDAEFSNLDLNIEGVGIKTSVHYSQDVNQYYTWHYQA